MLLPADWPEAKLSLPAACCSFIFNRHMRVIVFSLIFSFLVHAHTEETGQNCAPDWSPDWFLIFCPCISLDTLVHFFSFVTSCLSWCLSTEADRCFWLLLLYCTESSKGTPSAPPEQLWYSNITTVHCICMRVTLPLSPCVSVFGS